MRGKPKGYYFNKSINKLNAERCWVNKRSISSAGVFLSRSFEEVKGLNKRIVNKK